MSRTVGGQDHAHVRRQPRCHACEGLVAKLVPVHDDSLMIESAGGQARARLSPMAKDTWHKPSSSCVDGSRRHEMNLSLAMEVEVGAKYNHGRSVRGAGLRVAAPQPLAASPPAHAHWLHVRHCDRPRLGLIVRTTLLVLLGCACFCMCLALAGRTLPGAYLAVRHPLPRVCR
jgi:hypothetical protein